jgi:uncharacterized OB-fold protein
MKLFSKSKEIDSYTLVDVNQFSVGQILKMSPGAHTKKPYYVIVVYFNGNAKHGQIIMTTSIPGQHECNMVVGSNWEYHHKRMTIIATESSHSHLLYNQKLK